MNVVVNSCLHPHVIYRLKGINPATGKHYTAASVEDLQKWTASSFEEMPVRCGKCYNCVKAKSRGLVARCVAESRMHSDSSFVTLTVDDDNISRIFGESHSLSHRPFQLFLKRLRKRFGVPGIKYMMCGEYGELSCRPHYHAILFGVPAFLWRDSGVQLNNGFGLVKLRDDNPVFHECWPFGQVYLGDVTPASVSYVCGYTMKQFVLGRDEKWYKARSLSPEYVRWSRRPGLGRSYFLKHGLDLVDFDRGESGVSIDGKRYYAGRYFADYLHLTYPHEYARLLSSYEPEFRDRVDEVRQVDKAIDSRNRRYDCSYFRDIQRKRL